MFPPYRRSFRQANPAIIVLVGLAASLIPVLCISQTRNPEERDIVVKEQNAVFRALEEPCDPQEETAEHPVQALGQPTAEAGQNAIMFRFRLTEGKGQAKVLHRDPLSWIARPAQAPVKGFQHLSVVKAERRLQTQPGRIGKDTRQKSRQPTVSLGNLHTGAVFQAQLQRTGQHFLLPGRLKMRVPVFRLGQKPVAVIDTDLSACVDAVLAFPEFDQPCPAPVIEIHRKGVEHHLEPGRQAVISPGIPAGLLPSIHGR